MYVTLYICNFIFNSGISKVSEYYCNSKTFTHIYFSLHNLYYKNPIFQAIIKKFHSTNRNILDLYLVCHSCSDCS